MPLNRSAHSAERELAEHLSIADSTIMGTPAFGYKDWLRSVIIFKQLPNMKRKLDELDKKVNE
jgi:UDP-3-O-[3-hydroxymyristoyl] glucosamine N-acyltransferase